MNRTIMISIVLTIIFLQTIALSTNSTKLDINKKTGFIIVDDNGKDCYTKIQDAIDAASNGDIVFIKNGIYYENIVIDKSIKLVGENKYSTIIDGKAKILKLHSIVIQANTDNVEISNLTIQNAKGINGRGLYFLKNGGQGISEKNIISNNIIKNCSYGLMIINPKNNTVVNNSFYNCNGGFYYSKLPYYQNIFSNNTVNDKPILLLTNQKNMTIQGNYGVVDLIDCKNITIKNISTSNITVGIDICFSDNITVTNCTITHTNRGGIYMHYSNNCTFTKNTFKHDNWAVFLRGSNNNQILKNNFIDITKHDWFDRSYNNTWDGNYWEKSRHFPKLIFGKTGKNGFLPAFNIDWNPAGIQISKMG